MAAPGARPQWALSRLDPALRLHQAPAGTVYRGWRLRPGLVVDAARLIAVSEDSATDAAIAALINDMSRVDPVLDEALAALAVCGDVSTAAAACGLGRRSLQRCVTARTGQPPVWWLRLARARRAARALDTRCPAEVAAIEGYSDQAHLTRELRGFFGATPGQFRRGHGPLIGPGYGACTAVHNSTSVPSGVRT